MDPVYRASLLRYDPSLTIWTVGDPGVPARGTPDPDILLWCEASDFVLVTNNRRSMPVHLAEHLSAGRHVPGILVLRHRATVSAVLESLQLIVTAASPGDL